MKSQNFRLHQLQVILATVILTGCTSTEVISPPDEKNKLGETITLSIGAPEATKVTRADNEHVLRFTAIAYNGKGIDTNEFVERQEVIATDAGTETVTFKVPEGTYTFLIIGDYIPSANVDKKDSKGHYPDAYYNTTLDDDKIYMRSFFDFKTEERVNFNCLNNDNYDCFAKTIQIIKTADTVEQDVSLQRIVSKVSVVSTTPPKSEINNVDFNTLDFWGHYNFNSSEAGTYAGNKLSALQSISCDALSKDANDVIFFFYTLAPKSGYETLGSIEFNVNYKDGSAYTSQIPDRKIKPMANYKITIKGAFLSEPIVEKGDIILHLSTSQDWNESNISS